MRRMLPFLLLAGLAACGTSSTEPGSPDTTKAVTPPPLPDLVISLSHDTIWETSKATLLYGPADWDWTIHLTNSRTLGLSDGKVSHSFSRSANGYLGIRFNQGISFTKADSVSVEFPVLNFTSSPVAWDIANSYVYLIRSDSATAAVSSYAVRIPYILFVGAQNVALPKTFFGGPDVNHGKSGYYVEAIWVTPILGCVTQSIRGSGTASFDSLTMNAMVSKVIKKSPPQLLTGTC